MSCSGWLEQRRGWVIGLTLALPLLAGCVVFGDYGLGLDEPVQRLLGRQAWRYVLAGNPAYLQNPDRFYGVAFELALMAAEKLLGISDARPAFLVRHLATFVLFWSAGVCLFAVARRLLGSWRPALLASILLFLSPRVVADAFGNSKDLPFLSLFVVAVLTLLRYVEKPTLGRALAHAVACALATDVRVLGVLLPGLTVLALAASALERPRRPPARWWSAAAFAAAYLGAVVLFWPFLWQSPVAHFALSFARMAHYPWAGEVLFLGRLVPTTALPWYYLPVWIVLTTPASVTLLFLLGIPALVRRALGGGPAAGQRVAAVVVLGWAALPPASVVLLGSTLYDGWRHMFFVAPAMVVSAAAGAQALWRCAVGRAGARWRQIASAAMLALAALDLVSTAAWMVRWHPYQNVYFNAFAGERAALPSRFEMDYWGLSARELLERVVRGDARPSIALRAIDDSGEWSARLLPRAERARLRFVGSEAEADYIVTNFRQVRTPPLGTEEVFTVRVDGARIGSVFRPLRR